MDTQIGRFVAELKARGLSDRAAIIISAKHGQSPTDPARLTRIPDGPIIDALNAAWTAAGHPGTLVSFAIDDDGVLMWLSDRSSTGTGFAADFLSHFSGTGNDINGAPNPYTSAGLAKILVGRDAADLIGVPVTDDRVPDVVGISQVGVVYTGGHGKIAEQRGDNLADRDVPILVSAPDIDRPVMVGRPVHTTQIAPTILALLGLNPNELQAVRSEHTTVLPGLDDH